MSAVWGFILLCLTHRRRMKEGRGEGGGKPPSSGFRQKTCQPRDGLTLKRANAISKPCRALLSQGLLWHPKASQTRLDEPPHAHPSLLLLLRASHPREGCPLVPLLPPASQRMAAQGSLPKPTRTVCELAHPGHSQAPRGREPAPKGRDQCHRDLPSCELSFPRRPSSGH